ncbi:MAG: xanthine dehydrogenase family protein molybdopterin-binding subunit [Gammaproteobacteria bacterium]
MAWDLIGKDFVPPDIRGKVTGRAKYAEDYRAEGMVFGRVLTSPVPHANIVNIDASEALAMDGVLGIITADDEGLEGLLTNEPKYVGDFILAIAATDETIAQDAIDRVNLEFEPLSYTVDPLESLYPGGPDARADGNNVGGGRTGLELRQVKWTAADFASVAEDQLPMGDAVIEWAFGDLDAGFEDATYVIDESFVTQGNSHHSMEPRTAMAYWENGKCYVHSGSQSLTASMPSIASQLGVGLDDFVYINEYCGGGFGSKGTPGQTVGIAGHLSRKISRPVMLRVSRHEEFYIGSARGSLQGRVRLGFAADGRITAVDFSVVQDGGANGGFQDAGDAAAALSIVYQPGAMRFRGIPVVTNTTPRGPQRGPGQNQIAAAVEPLIDRAARELGLDRFAIRRLNAPDNSGTVGGRQLLVSSAYMPEALDKGAAAFDWETQSQTSGQRTGSKVRGVGIGQAYHDVGRTGYDGLVVLTPDGMLQLHSGVGNLGTYSYASTVRAAAEILKCDWENCVVHQGSNAKFLPWASTQTGSNTSWTMSRTNYVAAVDAVNKLKEIAAMDLGGEPDDYDIGEHRVFATEDPDRFLTYAQAAQRAIEIGGRFSGETPPDDIHEITRIAVAGIAGTGLVGVAKDTLRMEGDIPALACGFAAVDVDVETGKIDILDYVGVADCGTVFHPQGLSQQLKGGGVWGVGLALFERQIYDPQNGLPGNTGFEQCKPPTYLDLPPEMRWDAVDIADPQNPVGARGIGEPPMGACAAAILCAISDALGGHVFNRTPVVPDMIVNYVAGRDQSSRPLQLHTA